MEETKKAYTGETRRALSELHKGESFNIPEPALDAVHIVSMGMAAGRSSLSHRIREVCIFSLLYMMKQGAWPTRLEIGLAFKLSMDGVDFVQGKIHAAGLRVTFREDI